MRYLKIGAIIMAMSMTTSCSNKTDELNNMTDYKAIFERKIVSPVELSNIFPKSAQEIECYAKFAKELAQEELSGILKINPVDRTFDNTMRALDCSEAKFSQTAAVIQYLGMVVTENKMRDASHVQAIALSQFAVETYMNKDIYQAFKDYLENKGKTENLNEEQRYYLQEAMKGFKRHGLDLPKEKLQEVKDLNKQISKIGHDYETNIAADKSTIKVSLNDLAGVSDSFIKGLKKDGELFVLGCDYPTYFEVMQNCNVEKTRKALYFTFQNRAYPNNIELLDKLIASRDELAAKLGFEDFSSLNIDGAMAKTPKKVEEFLLGLASVSSRKSSKEFAELKKELPKGVVLADGDCFKPWDVSYVKNIYKKKHFNVDENKIAEYFPVKKALDGMLDIYQEFLGLKFIIVKPDWAWHPDVELIQIHEKNNNKLIGYIFLDLYPRDNKYSHACCAPIIQRQLRKDIKTGEYVDIPYVGMVIANFPKATKERPALLKHSDVETFFHEFGHSMHGVLGRTEMASDSGTSVKRDFVEVPSQMLEEWMFDKEMLNKVSGHYKTGEPLPLDLIEKKIALKQFDSGSFVLRQVVLAFLSLETFKKGAKKDIDSIKKALHDRFIKDITYEPDTHMQAAFGHLIGYGAKYYGYLWSKVFALDIFYEIKKHGLLDQAIGQKLIKTILGKGGSKDPNLLLKDFLGREPNQEAFFNDLGFLNK